MGIVSRAYSEVDDNIGEASSINRVVDDLYTLVNGNLNSANLLASGVANSNLQDLSVDADKIDHEIKLYMEVFG